MHLFVISKKLKIKLSVLCQIFFGFVQSLYSTKNFYKGFFGVFLKVLLSKKKMDAKL